MSANCTKILFTLVAGVLITVFQVPVVYAQDGLTLEEITVTARKREESLLDVPLSISAFSADKIETMALNHLVDLVAFSPGFYYAEQSVGSGARAHRRLLFRGMNPRTDIQTRQNATLFIDGAPTLGSELGATENYERIEVIKGPQSAYFGRSTFSGAINAVTKTPGNEWHGQFSAEGGRFDMYRFRAQMEGPIIPDKVAFRLSASTYSKDGEFKNAAIPGQRLGSRDTDDFAGTLYITPNDNLSLKLRAHFWEDSDGPSASIAYGPDNNPDAFNCRPGPRDWICGKVPYPRALARDTDYDDIARADFDRAIVQDNLIVDELPDRFGLERNAHELTAILDYEFDNGISFNAIIARHEDEYASMSDVDGRATKGLEGNFFFTCPNGSAAGGFFCDANAYQMLTTHLEDFHAEVRVNSADDQRIRWMIGGTYSDREQLLMTFTRLVGFTPNPSSITSVPLNNYEPETIAVFGSLSYDVTDQLTLNAELRYQEDEITEGTTTADRSIPKTELNDTFKSLNPRFILQWKPSDNMMLFASYAEGTSPGLFNAALVALSDAELAQIRSDTGADTSADEQDLTSYEIGVKGSLADGRARFALTGYYGDWEGIHQPEIAGYMTDAGEPASISIVAGGGDANIYGIEFEGTALLTEQLLLDTTFAWNKTDIKELNASDAASLLGPGPISGKEFSRYPEHSGTAALTFTDQLMSTDLDWFGRIDYLYSGSTWLSAANLAKSGETHTVNLRAGVENENWRLEFYGTNIFNEKDFSQLFLLFDFSGLNGGFGRAPAGALIPRPSYGARLSYRF